MLNEQKVTPYEVMGDIDYDKLLDNFGAEEITPEILKRIEELTGRPPHHLLRRGIFFSHRQLDTLLNEYEKGNKFYVYTGRGPSGEMHIGHLIPFMFTKYLQDAFDVPVVIQLTDDEKYLMKNLSEEQVHNYMISNVKDIIAIGFDQSKTFIFSNLDYMGFMYKNVIKISKFITLNQVHGCFGFNNSDSIGKHFYPAIQIAPTLSSSFEFMFGKEQIGCLVPQAIDQDPFFRMGRDVAERMGLKKPFCLHSKFIPPLQGKKAGKMSSSIVGSSIYLNDTEKEISRKIKSSFSGGKQTLQEHREKGGDPDVDIAYQILCFFFLDDDKLKGIYEDYKKGVLLTSDLKKEANNCLWNIVREHQIKRSKVTDEMVKTYMSIRKLNI